MNSLNITVDGVKESIPITPLDTIDSIKLQIAKKLRIPVKTIFIKAEQQQKVEELDDLPFSKSEKIIETSDIGNMKLDVETLISPEKIKKLNLLQAIDYAKTKLEEEEAIMFVFHNKFKTDTADFINNSSSSLYRDNFDNVFNFTDAISRGKFKSLFSTNEFIRKYNQFTKKLAQELNEQDKLTNTITINEEFSKRKKEILQVVENITASKLTHTVLKVVLSDKDLGETQEQVLDKDIFEIFNNTNVSSDVPYVSVANFYKVLKGFKCPPTWVENAKEPSLQNNQNTMILYVLNKYNYTKLTNKSTDYSKIIITIENNNIVILIDSKVDDYKKSTDLKEEQLLVRICDALKLSYSNIVCKIYPQEIKCIFYITDEYIKKLIYLDLCMNDKTISSFLAANERYRIFNKRGGVQTILKQHNIVFQLQSLYVTYPVRKRVGSSVRIGDNVVEIRVTSAKNLEEVEKLKQYLGLLTVLYNEKKECLEDIYSTFISDFKNETTKIESLVEKVKQEAEKKEEKLKDIAPEVFVKGFPRKCAKPPKVVSEKDYEKLKKKVDLMKYPLYGEYDDVHYYSCQHSKAHPYPGLIKMEVNGEPHLAPCCFDVKQSDKIGSMRYIYENEEEEEDKDEKSLTKSLKMTKTLKTLSPNRLGILTKDVAHFFRLVDPFNIYVRHYVPKGPRSIIAAIAIATKVENTETQKGMNKYINKIITKMKKAIEKNFGFQNAYQYDITSLKNFLDQEEKFLDIRLFADLLEAVTGYRILFFTHNKSNPDGSFSSPNFTHNLLLNNVKTNKPHIILYETTGSASEKNPFPHYEVISVYNKQEKEIYSVFEKDDKIVKELDQLYKDIYLPFNKQTGNVINKVPFKTPILQQHVDFFGKTRILYFEGGVNVLTIPIDSLPFAQIEEVEGVKPTYKYLRSFKYAPVELKNAINFLKAENIPYKKVKVRDYLVGITSNKQGLNFYIPIKPVKENTENEKIQEIHSVTMIGDSTLENFIRFEQISRQLLSHVLYHFSKFVVREYENNGTVLSPQNILSILEDFNNKMIVIDESLSELDVYKNIPRLLQKETSFVKDGKIIMTSSELAKRILYAIYVETKKGYDNIYEFKNKIYAPNFYQNIRDFQSSENNVMFSSEKDILTWIRSSEEPSQKIFDMFIEEFVIDIKKHSRALISSDMINNITPDLLQSGVYECKRINTQNVVGTVYVLNPENVEKIGSGYELYLSFKYDEEEYFLLMTKYGN